MKHLTIRGLGDELRKRLESLAQERGTSINKAALLLLRRGAGLDDGAPAAHVVGDSLDAFIGTWSATDEREFLKAIAAMEQVDHDLWR